MHARLSVILAIVLLGFASAKGQTQVGTGFTYQGQLKNAGQLVTGSVNLVVNLYDAAAGGNLIGAQTINGVQMTDGLFAVSLNASGEFGAGALNGDKRWLEFSVNGITLSPRQELTAAPYALTVRAPLDLTSLQAGPVIRGANTSAASGVYGIRGEITNPVSINSYAVYGLNAGSGGAGVYGQSAGVAGTGVYGISNSTSGFGGFGVQGHTSSPAGRGVYGNATATSGDTYGVYGTSASTGGEGVRGVATATTGDTHGVYGRSDSPQGEGVLGYNSATGEFTGGYGVYGEAAGGLAVGVRGRSTSITGSSYGVYGVSSSPDGAGVKGFSAIGGVAVAGESIGTTGVGYGVSGESSVPTGRGVYGLASDQLGSNAGVYGKSLSATGTGVFGETTSLSGFSYGGRFENSSTAGTGVYGVNDADTGITYGGHFISQSSSGRGVSGWAQGSSGTIYGVLGQASTSAGGYAVFASGDMGASGLKPFRIDHPADPENKYLLHYAAESPEVINFYRGVVTLNAAGQAVVELPAYFARINKSPSYQLTPMGAPMPMLHVAECIDESALAEGEMAAPGQSVPACRFRIAGGQPSGKVSWEVKATRNDAWVRTRGAPVEVEKDSVERGTYQHPELYGQPKEKGFNYQPAPEPRSPGITTAKPSVNETELDPR